MPIILVHEKLYDFPPIKTSVCVCVCIKHSTIQVKTMKNIHVILIAFLYSYLFSLFIYFHIELHFRLNYYDIIIYLISYCCFFFLKQS